MKNNLKIMLYVLLLSMHGAFNDGKISDWGFWVSVTCGILAFHVAAWHGRCVDKK